MEFSKLDIFGLFQIEKLTIYKFSRFEKFSKFFQFGNYQNWKKKQIFPFK